MTDKALAGELERLLALMTEQVELNPSNYNHDDVCQLNSEAVHIYDVGRELIPRILAALSPPTSETGEPEFIHRMPTSLDPNLEGPTATGDAVERASAWLRECSTWLLTTDLDMQCPMETDPLDIADALDAIAATPADEMVKRDTATIKKALDEGYRLDPAQEYQDALEALARIDAALNKGGA